MGEKEWKRKKLTHRAILSGKFTPIFAENGTGYGSSAVYKERICHQNKIKWF